MKSKVALLLWFVQYVQVSNMRTVPCVNSQAVQVSTIAYQQPLCTEYELQEKAWPGVFESENDAKGIAAFLKSQPGVVKASVEEARREPPK